MASVFERFRPAATVASIAVLTVFLSGCFDENHYTHSDFITRQAGDAMAVNNVAQTIDPWPREAKNRTLDVDGKRASVAIRRYEQNNSVPPKGVNTTTVSDQAGPGPQSTTSVQN